jgi:uncharacterized membrane protein YedE/YeeE
MKFLEFLIELIYWFGIFLCPAVLFGFIGFVVHYNFNNPAGLLLSIVFYVFGVGLGVFFAERMRRAVGCSTFMTRMTPWSDSEKDENK